MNCDNGLTKTDNNTTEHVLSNLSHGNKKLDVSPISELRGNYKVLLYDLSGLT